MPDKAHYGRPVDFLIAQVEKSVQTLAYFYVFINFAINNLTVAKQEKQPCMQHAAETGNATLGDTFCYRNHGLSKYLRYLVSMKQRRTSLKEMAEQLGVSIATVSRALRDSHEVGAELKSKTQALAKKLNYRPNQFAQSLRQKKSKVIGVVVPNLVTHYYAAVLDGIEDYASKSGYAVIAANSHEDHLREEKAVDSFIGMYVDGIIACLAQDTTDYSHFVEISDMGIPLVFFARTCLPDLFSSVTSNGDEAAKEATLHLIDTGSRRIAFIGAPQHLDMMKRRKHGYIEALRERKIEIDRSIIINGNIDFNYARETTMQMLKRDDRPDAILAFNDIITYAAFDAIKSLGLRIPDDVAIIGFTETDTSFFVTPKLSAIMDQAHLTGEKTCELLLKNIAGDKKIYKEVVPMILKIRESSDKKTVK